MAALKNQKYAIVTSQAEVVIVKKMGVAEKNIFQIHQCRELIQQMHLGDVLCVASVRCIAIGTFDFYVTMLELEKRSIEFQSANEKYLNFSTLKPLPAVCVKSIRVLAEHEREFLEMIGNSRMNTASKNTLAQRIKSEFMTCLCVMFCNDGIRKRGA